MERATFPLVGYQRFHIDDYQEVFFKRHCICVNVFIEFNVHTSDSAADIDTTVGLASRLSCSITMISRLMQRSKLLGQSTASSRRCCKLKSNAF